MNYVPGAQLLVVPALLVIPFLLHSKKRIFWRSCLIHTAIFVAYTLLILNCADFVMENDDYGLGQIGLFILCVICHTITGFVLATNSTFKQAKNNFHILNEL